MHVVRRIQKIFIRAWASRTTSPHTFAGKTRLYTRHFAATGCPVKFAFRLQIGPKLAKSAFFSHFFRFFEYNCRTIHFTIPGTSPLWFCHLRMTPFTSLSQCSYLFYFSQTISCLIINLKNVYFTWIDFWIHGFMKTFKFSQQKCIFIQISSQK